MATVHQWIKALGRESMTLVINPKYTSLLQEIADIEKEIDYEQSEGKKEFQKLMEKHKIPMEDWCIYDAVRTTKTDALILRSKALKKELRNILPIWEELNGKKPDKNRKKFDERIEEARQVPIEDLFQGNTKKRGGRISANCPFHQEDTPSFFIFTDKNTFKCFGCGARGDSIEFYMKINGCDFKTAVNELTHN